ncbi:MAG: DUF4118 domain-containing protein [Anaerostipes sp.]|nr:DUF4118 domain-containing protein [Anaerostipes sp.]
MNEKNHRREHVLVCLSSAPSNARIIETASRMARAFQGDFTALFVETPDFVSMSRENKKRLNENIFLAKQLGAKVETCYGDDVPYQISEFARLSGVTNIVIGRSAVRRRRLLIKPTITDQLIDYAPNADIHIIPDRETGSFYLVEEARGKNDGFFSIGDIIKCFISLFAATCVGVVFHRFGFSEANIIMVYILSVLITAVITTYRGYSLASSIISVIVFNFFFTEPRYTLFAYDKGYPVTFIVMFLAAFITGSLAAKQKAHANQLASLAYRTKLLFDANQLLQKAKGREEIMTATANQLLKLLDRDMVTMLRNEKGNLDKPHIYLSKESRRKGQEECLSEEEKEAALWTLQHNKHAGAGTDHYSHLPWLYLAIRVNSNVYGVIGIEAKNNPLDAFENSIVLSILGECALALENKKNAREKEEAAILAKNEQLRANLLRGISHDLRTPLTSISGNASNLLSNGNCFDEQTKVQIYGDIYEDAMWLINMVENLLYVTRIEEGRMQIHMSAELIDEAIEEALRHIKGKGHQIRVESTNELILARMDPRLIVQTMINILDNAVKYTPEGSEIIISVKKDQGQVIVEIKDQGPGIPDEAKPHIFEMFYTGTNQASDSRRSMGLGLYLCKAIIDAHGGEITVLDHKPRGTIFRFTLSAEEVSIDE